MLAPGAFPYICKIPDQIPEQAYSNLRREVGMAVGQSVSKIFPEFSKAFPCTVAAMEAHWPMPMIACKQVAGEWLVTLLMERSDLNLYFDLTIASVPLDGPDFEQGRSMLPLRWRELYRWFWSFGITDASVRPMFWRNTPFSYPSRLAAEEYRQRVGAKKSAVRDLEKKIGADQLYLNCWLWTEAGDALFLDELHNDQKVYHVRNDDLTDVEVLRDPEEVLDRYLAHVVSGGLPRTFDFRRGCSV